jgi:hypothetical protein
LNHGKCAKPRKEVGRARADEAARLNGRSTSAPLLWDDCQDLSRSGIEGGLGSPGGGIRLLERERAHKRLNSMGAVRVRLDQKHPDPQREVPRPSDNILRLSPVL